MWLASLAKTKELHESSMKRIEEASPPCHLRLSSIPKSQWCLYRINREKSHRLLHISTSNGVESEMSRLKKLGVRFSSPYGLFKGVIDLWGSIYAQGVSEGDRLKKGDHLLTKYAEDLHKREFELSDLAVEKDSTPGRRRVFIDADSEYNKRLKAWSAYSFEINLDTGECSCDTSLHMGVMCCHKLSMRTYRDELARSKRRFYKRHFNQCWLAKTYCKCYKEAKVPTLPSDYTFSSLARKVHAPPAKRARGRPKLLRHKGADEARGGGTKRSVRMESRRRLISRSQGERIDVTAYKTGLARDDIVNSGDEESVDPDGKLLS